mmetsp:Transcript_28126/g.90202  ORF Transcript_28126/g.90202 Transcript_28126/m.90202 type:complete len:259 (+) Transcript_28126:571-1347(+)
MEELPGADGPAQALPAPRLDLLLRRRHLRVHGQPAGDARLVPRGARLVHRALLDAAHRHGVEGGTHRVRLGRRRLRPLPPDARPTLGDNAAVPHKVHALGRRHPSRKVRQRLGRACAGRGWLPPRGARQVRVGQHRRRPPVWTPLAQGVRAQAASDHLPPLAAHPARALLPDAVRAPPPTRRGRRGVRLRRVHAARVLGLLAAAAAARPPPLRLLCRALRRRPARRAQLAQGLQRPALPPEAVGRRVVRGGLLLARGR